MPQLVRGFIHRPLNFLLSTPPCASLSNSPSRTHSLSLSSPPLSPTLLFLSLYLSLSIYLSPLLTTPSPLLPPPLWLMIRPSVRLSSKLCLELQTTSNCGGLKCCSILAAKTLSISIVKEFAISKR